MEKFRLPIVITLLTIFAIIQTANCYCDSNSECLHGGSCEKNECVCVGTYDGEHCEGNFYFST
jgi:hypothetical protein